VSRAEEKRKAYRVLMGNRERKRPLGRAENRLDDNIKKGIK
jgi:hypothetical protein